MMKISVRNVRVKVSAQYRRAGSVLAGTAASGCDGVQTDVTLDSDEPPERVAELIRMAEGSCFAMGTVRNPTPCTLTATVNGKLLDIADPAASPA